MVPNSSNKLLNLFLGVMEQLSGSLLPNALVHPVDCIFAELHASCSHSIHHLFKREGIIFIKGSEIR